MENISFKERVKNAAIANAFIYREIFVKYDYLVCSKAYIHDYYIIKGDRNNYLHLIGIHTDLTAGQFFEKCVASDEHQLKESDFDFIKPGRSEKSVKGSVREKITALPHIQNFFHQTLWTEENFKKNNVDCAFATSDNQLTIGFVKEGRPKTLLKSNELNPSRQQKVDLIFRKQRDSDTPYTEMIYGDIEKIGLYRDSIKYLIDNKFLNHPQNANAQMKSIKPSESNKE